MAFMLPLPHPLRGRITAYYLTPLLLFLLVSPVAGRAATLPTWTLAPGQTPEGVVLDVPGIAPMQSETDEAWVYYGIPIDIAGDGRPEVFFCYGTHPMFPPQKQPCRFIELGGDGSVEDRSFALLGPELPGMNGPREVTVADFNGDGQPDIYVANQGWDAQPYPMERNVLLVSRPDGTYENRSASLPVEPDFTHSSTAADLEGDGDIDIMVGNVGIGGQKTYLLINDGDGNFVQDTSRLPATLVDLAEDYTDFLLVDANGDGFPDLFMGTWNPLLPSAFLLNDGSGSFANLPRIELPPGPLGADNTNVQDTVVMMLNNDSFPDLVVLSTSRDYVGTGVQALVSNGDGTFRDETAARFGANAVRFTGPYWGSLGLADLNADGAMDFHFGVSNQVGLWEVLGRYWINDGFGNFTLLPANYLGLSHESHEFEMRSISVDFNGDGRPDQLQLGHAHAGGGKLAYRSFFNTTPPPPPINASLNDAWKNPDTPGQGFFVNVFPDIGQVFLAWFTYDTTRPAGSVNASIGEPGHRWITAFGPYADNQAVLDIEITQGGVFNAANPAPTQHVDGTVILEFSNCNAGTVTYDIPSIGKQGLIPIQRISSDNTPACEALAGVSSAGTTAAIKSTSKVANRAGNSTAATGSLINRGLNDAWKNPATSGQGFFINVFPGLGKMFLAWFTYDTTRPPGSVHANLADPGHRWLTAFGDYSGNQAVLDIEVTQGGVFNAASPAPTQHEGGTVTVDMTDCVNGTVTYDIDSANLHGEIPIQRIALDNVPLCQSLAAQGQQAR